MIQLVFKNTLLHPQLRVTRRINRASCHDRFWDLVPITVTPVVVALVAGRKSSLADVISVTLTSRPPHDSIVRLPHILRTGHSAIMSACLVQLPSELLLMVLEFLSIDRRATSALAALCSTSQRFRHLAEPYLYASYSNKTHIDKPHLFPLSLIGRPYLADHVREIDLHVPYRGYLDPIPQDALRTLQATLDIMNFPPDLTRKYKDFLGFLGLSRIAACAELSMVLASRNLECLSLHLKNFGGVIRPEEYFMINHILFDTPNWSGCFEKVRSVSVTFTPFNRGLYDFAFVFKMPSLRRVEFVGCEERALGQSLGWDGHGELEANLGQWRLVHNSNVESIILRASDVGHSVVNVLLNCCKALKSLHVEVDLPRPEWHIFQFFRLQDALCRHAQSLEQLIIVQDEKNKVRQKEPGFGDSGALSFMSYLCKLHSAVIPLCTLTANLDAGMIYHALDNDDWSSESTILKKYLPPSPATVSIRNDNVYYSSTKQSSGLA